MTPWRLWWSATSEIWSLGVWLTDWLMGLQEGCTTLSPSLAIYCVQFGSSNKLWFLFYRFANHLFCMCLKNCAIFSQILCAKFARSKKILCYLTIRALLAPRDTLFFYITFTQGQKEARVLQARARARKKAPDMALSSSLFNFLHLWVKVFQYTATALRGSYKEGPRKVGCVREVSDGQVVSR